MGWERRRRKEAEHLSGSLSHLREETTRATANASPAKAVTASVTKGRHRPLLLPPAATMTKLPIPRSTQLQFNIESPAVALQGSDHSSQFSLTHKGAGEGHLKSASRHSYKAWNGGFESTARRA